jgi:hypothetical protein
MKRTIKNIDIQWVSITTEDMGDCVITEIRRSTPLKDAKSNSPDRDQQPVKDQQPLGTKTFNKKPIQHNKMPPKPTEKQKPKKKPRGRCGYWRKNGNEPLRICKLNGYVCKNKGDTDCPIRRSYNLTNPNKKRSTKRNKKKVKQ